jgi:uncharacterized protein (DUF1778 family)
VEVVNIAKKTQSQCSNAYNARAYDRLAIQVKKGNKEIIRAYAARHGESLNGFVNRVIREAMEREISE